MMTQIPFGYLTLIILLAICTYYVLAPAKWPRTFPSIGIYFEAINDLPFFALFLLLASTLLAFREGYFAYPVGKITLALTIGVAAGLCIIIYRGLSAAPAIRRALNESFGKEWLEILPTKLKKQVQKNFTFSALLGPFYRRRLNVKRISNISYGPAGERNLLDIYHSRSPHLNRPVLIHMHGGSFKGGRKNTQSLPLIYKLASEGWLCISANYRLSAEAQFPDHLIDLKQVIAWVCEHGKEYDVDASAIFLAGNSAGAHIVAMAGLTINDPRFQPGFTKVDTTVAGVICIGGYYSSIYKRINSPSTPMAYGGKNAPPFFIVHGQEDRFVPVEQADRFATGLRKKSGNPVIYVEMPNTTHTFDFFHSMRSEAVYHGVQVFSTWVLKNQAPHSF